MGSPKNVTHITSADISAGIDKHITATQRTMIDNGLQLVSGTTANRPTTSTIGFQYFDTTLGYPIWWNGTIWVKYNGTSA